MGLEDRFRTIFRELDQRLAQENREREKRGAIMLVPVQIKILGQTALLLAGLPFPIAGTMDLDAQIDGDFFAKKALTEILVPQGLSLDTDSHLIWIPQDAKFQEWYRGALVRVDLAEPDAVIASKLRFKRSKDKALVEMYLRYFPRAEKRLTEWGLPADWVKQ